jgi:hypothetical protein
MKVVKLNESDIKRIVKRVLNEDFAGTITHLPEIDGMLKTDNPTGYKASTEYIYPKDYKRTGEKLSITFYDMSDRDFSYPYLIQLRENNNSIPLWTKVYNWFKSNGARDTKEKGDDRYGKVTVLGVKDKNTVMKITNNLSSKFVQLLKHSDEDNKKI